MNLRQVIVPSPSKCEAALSITADGGKILFGENIITAEDKFLTHINHCLPFATWQLLLAKLDLNGDANQDGVTLEYNAYDTVEISWITSHNQLELGNAYCVGRKLRLTAPRLQLNLK